MGPGAVVGRISGSEITISEAPIPVLMDQTTPFLESAARRVNGLSVVRPLSKTASGRVAARVMSGCVPR